MLAFALVYCTILLSHIGKLLCCSEATKIALPGMGPSLFLCDTLFYNFQYIITTKIIID